MAAVKVFWLKPRETGCWFTPNEIVARLTKVFDNVNADCESAVVPGMRFISSYCAAVEAGLCDENSTPLTIVEKLWNDAVVLTASDDSGTTAPFSVVVRHEDTLQLEFPPKSPFPKKRRSAEKVAEALEYAIMHFDHED